MYLIKKQPGEGLYFPNKLLYDFRLTDSDLAVAIALIGLSEKGNFECEISKKDLAKYSRLSLKTVYKAVKHLEELGYLTVTPKYHTYLGLDGKWVDDDVCASRLGHSNVRRANLYTFKNIV